MKKSIKQMQSSSLELLSVRFLSNQKLLILLAAFLTAVSTYAYDFEADGIYYNRLSSTEVEVTSVSSGGVKYSGSIIIPSTVSFGGKSYSVTSIGYEAFYYCRGLTSVTIPSSVTGISVRAFQNCLGLTSVEIPNSVTSIGTQAFQNCSGMTSLAIGNSVTSIGEYAFNGCSGLSSVEIPNSVTSIGNGAFSVCSGMISVTIGNSVKSIGGSAFASCSGLTSVEIPNSVTSIGASAFNGCLNLCAFYGNYASEDNRCLISEVGALISFAPHGLKSYFIPNSVTSIGYEAFSHCSGLTSVIIPSSVTVISAHAFEGCSGLISIEIPNSVTSIGDLAFGVCSGLTSVTIGNAVTSIGSSAFNGCSGLTSVTVNNSTPANIVLGIFVFDNSSVSSATLYVPAGSKDLYAKAEEWKEFGTIEEFIVTDLVDGQPYTVTSDYQNTSVTYTRTFIPDIWQPLYVPFNMSYNEWKDYGQVAELSCVHAYEDGRTTIEFVTVNSGELLPNVPYVFLPNTGDEITFTCTNKTLKGAPAENTKYIMCSSPRYTFKIYGNYQPVSGTTLATYGDSQFNGAYVMTTDNKFQHCSPSATLKPYRFYITREKSTNGYWGAPERLNAPAAEEDDDDDVIYFMVDGKVCGIADIVTDTDGNSTIYDLTGREVKNPSNGIYIQNGKKIHIY